jgi:hypothetical protein
VVPSRFQDWELRKEEKKKEVPEEECRTFACKLLIL